MGDPARELSAQPTYVCPCETHGTAGSRHDRIGPAYLSVQHWLDRARLVLKWPELDVCLHTFPVLNDLLNRILPEPSPNSPFRLPPCEVEFATSRESRTRVHFKDYQALTLRTVDEDASGPHRKTFDTQADFFSTTLFLHPGFKTKIACVGQGKKALLAQRGAKMHLLLILISGRVELPPEIEENIRKLELPPPPPHAPPPPIGNRPEFLPNNEQDLLTVNRLRNKYADEVKALVNTGFDFAKHSPIVLLKMLRISFPYVAFSNAGANNWMVTVTTPHVTCSGNGVEVASAMEAALFHLVLLAVRGIEPSAIADIKAGRISTAWKPEFDLDAIFGNDRPIIENERRTMRKRSFSRDRRRHSRSRSKSRSRSRTRRTRDRHSRSRSRSRSRDRRGGGGSRHDRSRGRSRDRSPRRRSRSRSRTGRDRDRDRGGARKFSRSRSTERGVRRYSESMRQGPTSSSNAASNSLLPLEQSMPKAAANGTVPSVVPGIPDMSTLSTNAKLVQELKALPMELRALIANHPMATMWAMDPMRAMRMWVWNTTGQDVNANTGRAVQLNRTSDGFYVIASVKVPNGAEVQEVAPTEQEAVARVAVRVIVQHKA